VFLIERREEAIISLDIAVPSVAGVPSDAELHLMAEDIVSIAMQRLIDEIAYLVFDKEQ
jgi:hypothetical protein